MFTWINLPVVELQAEDPAITAWEGAVASDGGSVSVERRALVNSLVIGLKADGVWSKLDRLWLMAAENSQSALRDIRNTQLATLVSTPTFTTDRGYAGDGTSARAFNTGFIPGTTGGNYSLDSAGLGYWSSVRATIQANPRHGWLDAGPTNNAWVTLDDNTAGSECAAAMNCGFGSGIMTATDTTPEFGHGNRSAAGAQELYVDGVSVASNAQASTSLAGAVAIYFLARNFNGTINQQSDEQVAACWISGSLTGTDVLNFYTRLGSYMDAVGVPGP